MTLKKRLDRLASKSSEAPEGPDVIYIHGIKRGEDGELTASSSTLFYAKRAPFQGVLTWKAGSSDETLEEFEDRCESMMVNIGVYTPSKLFG